jgi:DNA-binding NtrC family response regulator
MGSPGLGGAAAGPRIVVADDDEAVLLTLSAILEKIDGATVTAAATFDDAMKALGEAPFDVLVTELTIDVPEDGLTLLGCAQELHPGIAGIVLTGAASLPSAIAALQLGASNYLLKPCNIEELKLAIRVALERRQSEGAGRGLQAARMAQHEAERNLQHAEQRVAGRIAGPLGSLRERVDQLQEQAQRLSLADGVRYDIQQVDLAASRVEATVDTFLGSQRAATSLPSDAVRADVLSPSRSRPK